MSVKRENSTRALLTPEEVRRLTSDWVDPNYTPSKQSDKREPNYWCAEERAKIVEKLKSVESQMLEMAQKGYPSQLIADIYGVSRECIAKRLRAFGYLNPPGKPGKPPAV